MVRKENKMKVKKNDAGAIFEELPWLEQIVEEKDLGTRPVYIAFVQEIPFETSVEYGRYNNRPDTSYTRGHTHIAYVRGGQVKEEKLREGVTPLPADKLDCDYIVLRYRYRSELVYDEPGFVRYDVAKPETVKKAHLDKQAHEKQLAQEALAILES
jgi:hypothetical protein